MDVEDRVEVRPEAGPRFWIGIALFGLGLICPVFVPLVGTLELPVAWKTVLAGLFMLGIPEVLWLAAAAVMGREGFDFLKAKLLGALREHVLPTRVGALRYHVGLLLFALPLIVGWVTPYVSTALPEFAQYQLLIGLAGDFLLLSSLFVLGPGFWAKLRALFVHDAVVTSQST